MNWCRFALNISIYRVFFLAGHALKVLSVGDGKIPTKKWKFESTLHLFSVRYPYFYFFAGILPSSTLVHLTSQKNHPVLYIYSGLTFSCDAIKLLKQLADCCFLCLQDCRKQRRQGTSICENSCPEGASVFFVKQWWWVPAGVVGASSLSTWLALMWTCCHPVLILVS